MTPIKIQTPTGERLIGPGQPVFIVVEMSGNHNQSYDQAIKIVDAAAQAGVDAVKLQTYTAATMTIDSDKEYFKIKGGSQWSGQTLHQLYQKAYTPWDWQPKLKKYAEAKGLLLFSTPFDETAVDFLEKMNVALYKIASFEVVDIPLLKKVGQTRKPVIMSRGMATIKEIELAVKTLTESGTPQLALLHCISSYPASVEQMNLVTISDMSGRFGVVTGLSDHSLSPLTSVVATALGASIIEKHFTIARAAGGPDADFSLEPAELKALVQSVREAEKSIGRPGYGAGAKESENIIFRRSLFVVQDIKKGDKFTLANIRSIRPGFGLPPKYYEEILGKQAAVDIARGTPLAWELIVT